MTDLLKLEYVPLDSVAQWDENPKKHDVGGIIEAFYKYGFVDPPKFDPSLNSGEGGLVYGNGRLNCLVMCRNDKKKPPRGISDNWEVPIIFGVDAESEKAAKELAIDHNNLTMSGGDFDATEMEKMWDSKYLQVVQPLDTITVPPEIVHALSKEPKKNGDVTVSLVIPAEHVDKVKEYLSNGNAKTSSGLGKGILQRMGIR